MTFVCCGTETNLLVMTKILTQYKLKPGCMTIVTGAVVVGVLLLTVTITR